MKIRSVQMIPTIACRWSLVWLFCLIQSGATFSAPQIEPKVYRIMAVGDSITEGGTNFVSYRYPLRDKLLRAGYRVEFVGSRESESPNGSLRHEGYSGKNAEFLAGILEARFRAAPADIVLIHAGHNHSDSEAPVPGILAANEKMIGIVRRINPRVVVLLAQVIPSGKLPKYAYIPELNVQLGRLATRLNSPHQPVIAVNMSDGFDWRTDTIEDHVHPNARGAEKIAEHWFGALTNVMEPPAPALPGKRESSPEQEAK